MEERIEGWDNIATAFPCAKSTFMNKHAARMLTLGYAFKSHIDKPGFKKKPLIWTFPQLIFAYCSCQQIKNKKV